MTHHRCVYCECAVQIPLTCFHDFNSNSHFQSNKTWKILPKSVEIRKIQVIPLSEMAETEFKRMRVSVRLTCIQNVSVKSVDFNTLNRFDVSTSCFCLAMPTTIRKTGEVTEVGS